MKFLSRLARILGFKKRPPHKQPLLLLWQYICAAGCDVEADKAVVTIIPRLRLNRALFSPEGDGAQLICAYRESTLPEAALLISKSSLQKMRPFGGGDDWFFHFFKQLLAPVDRLQEPLRIFLQHDIPGKLTPSAALELCSDLDLFLLSCNGGEAVWFLAEPLCRTTGQLLSHLRSFRQQLKEIGSLCANNALPPQPAEQYELRSHASFSFPIGSLWFPEALPVLPSKPFSFLRSCCCNALFPERRSDLLLSATVEFDGRAYPLIFHFPALTLEQARNRYGKSFAVLFKQVGRHLAEQLSPWFSDFSSEFKLLREPVTPPSGPLILFTWFLVSEDFSTSVELYLPARLLRPLPGVAGSNLFPTDSAGTGPALCTLLLKANSMLLNKAPLDRLQIRPLPVTPSISRSTRLLFHNFLNLLQPRDLILTLQAYISLGNPLAKLPELLFLRKGEQLHNAGFDCGRLTELLPARLLEQFNRPLPPGHEPHQYEAEQFITESISLMDKIHALFEEDRLQLSAMGAELLVKGFAEPRDREIRTLLAEMRSGDAVGYWYSKLSDAQRINLSRFTGQHWFWAALHGDAHITADLLRRISPRNSKRFQEDIAWFEKQLEQGKVAPLQLLTAKEQLISELQREVDQTG